MDFEEGRLLTTCANKKNIQIVLLTRIQARGETLAAGNQLSPIESCLLSWHSARGSPTALLLLIYCSRLLLFPYPKTATAYPMYVVNMS